LFSSLGLTPGGHAEKCAPRPDVLTVTLEDAPEDLLSRSQGIAVDDVGGDDDENV
jgi:hypothetical protein